MHASPMEAIHRQSGHGRRLNNPFICRRRGDESLTSPLCKGKVRDSSPHLLLFQKTDRAFTLTEMFVAISTIAVLVVLLLPRFRERQQVQWIYCNNNLKQVGLAFRMWNDDNGVYPMQYQTNGFDGPSFAIQQKTYVYFRAMSNELSTPKIVVCPKDTARTPGTNFTTDFSNSNVSYFVGLDAVETNASMLLSGDRNISNGTPPRTNILELTANQQVSWPKNPHGGLGNILFTDGSVQSTSSQSQWLKEALQRTGMQTNRLALP
jgi:prepilin-type processing-associated H-X9-DG protein